MRSFSWGNDVMRDAMPHSTLPHGMHAIVRMVDRLFHAAGTNGLYRKYGLERYFRDVYMAVQHAAGRPIHIESAGSLPRAAPACSRMVGDLS